MLGNNLSGIWLRSQISENYWVWTNWRIITVNWESTCSYGRNYNIRYISGKSYILRTDRLYPEYSYHGGNKVCFSKRLKHQKSYEVCENERAISLLKGDFLDLFHCSKALFIVESCLMFNELPYRLYSSKEFFDNFTSHPGRNKVNGTLARGYIH